MKTRVLWIALCVLCCAGCSSAEDRSGKYIPENRRKSTSVGVELPYIQLSKTGYFSIFSGSIGQLCGYTIRGNKITIYDLKGKNITVGQKATLDTKRPIGKGHFEGKVLVLDSAPGSFKSLRGGRFKKQ